MKGFKIKEKLKKSLIVTIVTIMIAFTMPVKSNANILNDFVDLLLFIPDGIMHVIDKYIGGSEEFTYADLEYIGGYDDGGWLYNFIVTPYDIFSSGTYEEINGEYHTKLGLLDINFFADKPIVNANGSNTAISSVVLAPVIGNVYKGLRNLCMILMLVVVLYIGIKIMISSIAAQQAKYKQLLVDWLVGFALLFMMHYIMSGLVYLNSVVVKMLSNEEGDSFYVGVGELEDEGDLPDTDSTWYDIWLGREDTQFHGAKYENFKIHRLVVMNSCDDEETFSNHSNGNSYIDKNTGRLDLNAVPRGEQDSNFTSPSAGYVYYGDFTTDPGRNWGENGVIYLSASLVNPGWNNKKYENKAVVRLNAMSYVRTVSSCGSEDDAESVVLYDNGGERRGDEDEIDNFVVMGFSILYLCLVIETIMFVFTYIKRVLQMSFLTMIAPIVAIMYPVDKIGDGKAQAFNTWFKDYLFNILIQPMHLLLYTIFFVAATGLVSRNIIYAIAIYGFMIPAEKYFKKVLGFEKASTGGGGPLGGAIGRGLAMDGLGRLAGIGPAARGGKGGAGGASGNKRKRPKTKKLTGSDDPTGPSGSGGSGGPSGSGGSGGSTSPLAPGAPPKKKPGTILSGIGGAIGSRADRGLKGLTGGKFRHLRDLRDPGTGKLDAKKVRGAALSAGLNGVKFVGRKAFEVGTRAGGMALMGAAGITAGAATAMATGDINNLWKGATVGIGAGNKIGGNVGDRVEGFYDDFKEEVKAERAKADPGYRAELRQQQAKDAYDEFIEELPPEDRASFEATIENYAPYMDEVVKGDESMLKALNLIDGDALAANFDGYDKIAIAQDARSWGDLRESKREKDYLDYLAKEQYRKDKGTEPTDAQLQSYRNDPANSAEEAKRLARLKLAVKAQGKLK
ncbi:MAG: hypothetical protein IKE91_08590 [Clostridia bacterium]|nr:hypothetical protein [Clostridia bacterium]